MRRRSAARLAVLIVLLARALAASAGNEPEKGQRRVEEDVLPKIVLACGAPLAVTWDGASLRKHNKDIGYDKTDGGRECNEPGKETVFADDGNKVVKEVVWKTGEIKQVTDLYLNGNPRLKEAYDEPIKKRVQAFWDTARSRARGRW